MGSAAGDRDPVRRALAFLAANQLPKGDFPIFASTDPLMEEGCVDDASVFPNALIAHSLSFCAEAAPLRERVTDFLAGEMDRNGLWRHWSRGHPQSEQLPPDLDDTSCASAVLLRSERADPGNRDLLLANRTAGGLFYTWLVPRVRWTGLSHMKVALAQLRHPLILYVFFRDTTAEPRDVDAVVNANVLFYLGGAAEPAPVLRFLLGILRDGEEAQCDKWYANPFAIWYFFSRALAPFASEAGDILRGRIAAAAPETGLDAALAIASLNYWRAPAPARLTDFLRDTQLPSGGWPRAALYDGGRPRRRDGSFAAPLPDTPRWGSEALSTAFALEALCGVAGAAGGS